MQPNPIKAALRRGETVACMWSATGSPDLAEAAVRLGWPCILVDNEHGVADLDQAVHIHRAVVSAGGEVILRVPSADPVHLKLVLDRGFRCIMAPMVNSPEEARAFAEACRYPPLGRRGYAAPIVRASGWGTVPDYRANPHEDLLLIAQIEHRDAVDSIEDIAAVDGIDALLLGPNDLAGSMGLLERLDHPDVLAACERVEKATIAAGKWYGSIVRPGRSPKALHELGCRLIAGPSDIGLFLKAARDALPDFTFTPAPAPAPEKPAAASATSAAGSAPAKKPARSRRETAARPAAAARQKATSRGETTARTRSARQSAPKAAATKSAATTKGETAKPGRTKPESPATKGEPKKAAAKPARTAAKALNGGSSTAGKAAPKKPRTSRKKTDG
jgi:4-hydroxy-2-oxoheptanedioate aldolase